MAMSFGSDHQYTIFIARIRFVRSPVEAAPFKIGNPHRLTCKAGGQMLLISPFQSEISDVPVG